MFLSNKNLCVDQRVLIRNTDDNNLIGQSGLVMGKDNSRPKTKAGEYYIVLLDKPIYNIPWKAVMLHESNIEKI